MYIALIRPHFDYCAQLWAPREGPLLDKLEKVLAYYSKLAPEIRHLDYEDRLKALKISSIQRRYDRYRVLYTRKSLMGIVPDLGFQVNHDVSHRNGLKIKIPSKIGMSLLRQNSFTVRGPEVFNSLPKDLREIDSSMEVYKNKLDAFLSLLNDSPRISHGSKHHSNNLDIVISEWNWSLKC